MSEIERPEYVRKGPSPTLVVSTPEKPRDIPLALQFPYETGQKVWFMYENLPYSGYVVGYKIAANQIFRVGVASADMTYGTARGQLDILNQLHRELSDETQRRQASVLEGTFQVQVLISLGNGCARLLELPCDRLHAKREDFVNLLLQDIPAA